MPAATEQPSVAPIAEWNSTPRSSSPQAKSTDLVALDDALNDLASLDEQQGRIVEMRFFGGLATEEIADVLGISESTVKRDWNVAKAWLIRQTRKDERGNTRPVAKN